MTISALLFKIVSASAERMRNFSLLFE